MLFIGIIALLKAVISIVYWYKSNFGLIKRGSLKHWKIASDIFTFLCWICTCLLAVFLRCAGVW